MTEKKVTKKEWFGIIRKIVAESDYANKIEAMAFIDREIELLDKKADRSKESKSQKTNEQIKETILEVLADAGKPMTISLLLEDERLSSYMEESKGGAIKVKMSNQKLSSLMTQLKIDNLVVRSEDKKKAYFSLPSMLVEEEVTEGESESE